jgi:hypothetical protein
MGLLWIQERDNSVDNNMVQKSWDLAKKSLEEVTAQ